MPLVSMADDVVAEALEVVAIEEVEALLGSSARELPFTEAERSYAGTKSDPARRLAARLAAKRAACALLGPDITPQDVEILPAWGGPPSLRLSARGLERCRARGGERLLVSLTHGRAHAAAAVLLLRSSR